MFRLILYNFSMVKKEINDQSYGTQKPTENLFIERGKNKSKIIYSKGYDK